MNSISTAELIESLKKNTPLGLEVSLSHGILRITKCIYLRGNSVFVYTNEFTFDFNPKDGFSISEFIDCYNQTIWLVENEIC